MQFQKPCLFLLPAIILFISLVNSSCGKNLDSQKIQVPLSIRLKIPSYRNVDEFWKDIEKKVILWRTNNENNWQIFDLEKLEALQMDFSVGGEMVFQGFLSNGFVMVQGKTAVPQWDQDNNQRKIIEIYIYRKDEIHLDSVNP